MRPNTRTRPDIRSSLPPSPASNGCTAILTRRFANIRALYHLNGKRDEQYFGERMRPRMLVSAPRRNQLGTPQRAAPPAGKKKVRDDEGVIANTRRRVRSPAACLASRDDC